MDISQETETRLAAEALRRGISVEALLRLFVEERVVTAGPGPARVGLPVWHLGGVGSLRRRDIYELGS